MVGWCPYGYGLVLIGLRAWAYTHASPSPILASVGSLIESSDRTPYLSELIQETIQYLLRA